MDASTSCEKKGSQTEVKITTLIRSSMLLDMAVSGPFKDKRQSKILNRYWLSALLLVQPRQPSMVSMVSILVPTFFIYYLSETFEDENRVISGRKSKEISENVKETNNDLNRKLKFEHKKPGVDSCAPEG